MEERVLRQGAAAALLGVTRKTLIDWEKRGYVRRIPRPGAWYRESDLCSFLLHGNPQLMRGAGGSGSSAAGGQEEAQA